MPHQQSVTSIESLHLISRVFGFTHTLFSTSLLPHFEQYNVSNDLSTCAPFFLNTMSNCLRFESSVKTISVIKDLILLICSSDDIPHILAAACTAFLHGKNQILKSKSSYSFLSSRISWISVFAFSMYFLIE